MPGTSNTSQKPKPFIYTSPLNSLRGLANRSSVTSRKQHVYFSAESQFFLRGGARVILGTPITVPTCALYSISDPLPIHELRWYSSLQILRTLCGGPEYQDNVARVSPRA